MSALRISQHAFLPHLLSVWSSPSQAHGSGGPEELHLLAESEPRCHGVRRAGLRYVQSASQAAVMWQREPATRSRGPSADSALCPLYLNDSRRLVDHRTRLAVPQNSLHPLPTTQARKNEQNLHFICIENVLVLFMLWGKETFKRPLTTSLVLQSVCKSWQCVICWSSLVQVRHHQEVFSWSSPAYSQVAIVTIEGWRPERGSQNRNTTKGLELVYRCVYAVYNVCNSQEF